MRRIPIMALAALTLTACAPQAVREGGWIERPAAESRSFTFAAPPTGAGPQDDAARAAVRDALVARGYREAEDGRYRVDVGFAVLAGSTSPVAGKPSAASRRIVLCKRHFRRLSVSLIERSSGKVVLNRSASIARCGETPAGLLAALAETALGSER